MTEWQVVGVIIALLGLIAAVVAPVVKLNVIIAKLAAVVEQCGKSVDALDKRNSESHDRIWKQLQEHDDTINNHETRLSVVENQLGGNNHGVD